MQSEAKRITPSRQTTVNLSFARIFQRHTRRNPMTRIEPPGHRPMKGRERPIRDMVRQPMAYRVEMNVIHVRGVIAIIADRMFPKPALPDAAFTPGHTACGTEFAGCYVPGEVGFDGVPAAGVIGIVLGQGP